MFVARACGGWHRGTGPVRAAASPKSVIPDFRLAWRMSRRGRGSTLVTVGMLAVAMAGTLTLFTVLTAATTLWPDFPQRERLARIYGTNPRLGAERDTIPLASFTQWAPQIATLEAISAYAADDREVENLPDASVQAVTRGYFESFGVPPLAGRVLQFDDETGAAAPAVVGERLARLKFGDPARALGQFVVVGDESFTIVGVMRRDFWFPTASVQVWIPLASNGLRDRRVTGLGLLRHGRTWSEARMELAVLAQHRDRPAAAIGWSLRPIPLNEDQQLRTRNGMIGLLGPALVVLLIACVNAANLMLSRGVERENEFAIRLALGASRGRIGRQLLVEGAVIASLAAAVGALLSLWGLRIFRSLVGGFSVAVADRIVFSSATLLATIVVALATPILVAIVPAMTASRRRPISALTGVATSRRGARAYGARDMLVFVEVALASVLVVLALMLFRLFDELHRIRPSYDPGPIVVASVGSDVRAADLSAMIERARNIPAITSVATIKGSLLPVDGAGRSSASMSGSQTDVPCSVVEVSGDYFRTLQLPMVTGRGFDADTGADSGVAVASVTLADRLWGGRFLPTVPLTLNGGIVRKVEIIGVAADALPPNRLGWNSSILYVQRDPAGGGPVSLLARAVGPASAVIQPLSRALSAAGDSHRLHVRPLADAVAFKPRDSALVSGVLMLFSTLALGLAAGGIFAVSRHSVLQRTREFGVRLALGATRGGLMWLVIARDLKLVAVAIVVAAAGTLAVTRVTFVELVTLAVDDPTFWIGTLVTLGGVSTAACYAAASRLSRLEPMKALRDL